LIFDSIPTTRPPTPLLDAIDAPTNLDAFDAPILRQLANELRAYLLYSVGQSGGHFGAGLGVIELTIALHKVLNTPHDRLIWDVGHQSYPHKILTGRREEIKSIRQTGGLAAFPKREESPYDCFGVGHSSTSISAALGMAIARDLNKENHHCVAVIGDGAITAGMAYEALNHAGHTKTKMLVILNDNSMSISENTGGLSAFLANMSKSEAAPTEPALVPSPTIFEDLGLRYFGPFDGNDLSTLPERISEALNAEGPALLHLKTQKGFGYTPALHDPVAYHALTKIEAEPERNATTNKDTKTKGMRYQDVFGLWLCDKAKETETLVGITPAMKHGSGMMAFAEEFPQRFFDVAIAEQHALTFAAGLACEGKKPVVAIYSTFLQRAYDQLIHDIALQNLDVTFAIDRAGVVGEDGPTHAGAFDLCFLRCIPNIMIAAPSNEHECYHLLNASFEHNGPAAVRYPRSKGPGVEIQNPAPSNIHKAKHIRKGQSVCILNFGALLEEAKTVANKFDYELLDMRWIKPLDTACILELSEYFDCFVTLEEGSVNGGAGSAVGEALQAAGIRIPLVHLGLPDQFTEHGSRSKALKTLKLDAEGIEQQINHALKNQELI